jgi:CDP-diacylglycerol--serine O-phosphatidyltransferase
MIFKLLQDIQEDDTSIYYLTEDFYYMGFVPYLGFIITLASAYRLAKFNIDTRQTDSFIGLPTPANALFIMSIPMIQFAGTHEWLVNALFNPFVLLAIILLSAYMLNAEIPLFSLKIKNFSWEKNKMQVFFLTIAASLLLILGFTALPIIILLYVVLSVLNNMVLAKK